MTSLKIIGNFGSSSLRAFLIIGCLAFAVTAQDIAPSNQGKMYGEPGFVGEAINLNVVNADIRDILNYITEQYGVNFVIDKSVKQVPITINVSNVPWNTAFDSILQSQELGVQVNGPILRVSLAKVLADEGEIAQKARENQLDTSQLYTEFIRLNYARATNTLGGEAGSAGGFVGGQSSSSKSSGGASGSADQGILGILAKRLSRRGAVEVDGRSNTLIITDVKENIDALRQLVFYLDQPTPQVEIEARIVVATRTFSRDLGFQLSAVVSDTTRGAGAIFSTLPGADNNSSPTTPTNPGAGFSFPEPNGKLGAAANTIIGLTTGVFGTARINALLTAGEQTGNVKTIATPRVTTLNNRPAEIESGQQIPIVTVQPGGATGGGAIVATTEYIPVPLRLAVTPQITNVGTVILQVVAENNSVPPNAGGTPAIATQRMKTEVMVPDGGTTVVGGALFDSESEIRDRTPGLSRIPLFGNLFKRKQVARNTNEIIFFITPRIYRPDYNGKPITDQVDNQPRSTRIVQPVPLGNPPSNSLPNSNPQNRVDPNQPPARPTPAPVDNGGTKSGN